MSEVLRKRNAVRESRAPNCTVTYEVMRWEVPWTHQIEASPAKQKPALPTKL